ncbi:MAG: hypothetical protein LBR89_01760 [Holosporales bacterium]|jgi:hypothetical protein|nr:hypothetical protein [Holosporales bacterium]
MLAYGKIAVITKMLKNGPKLMVGIALVSALLSTCGSGAGLPLMIGDPPRIVAVQEEVSQGQVCDRIRAILGAEPNRSELIQLARGFFEMTLDREEKRVKARLLAKLEQNAESILAILDTPEGIKGLRGAYIQILKRKSGNIAPIVEQPRFGGAIFDEPRTEALLTAAPLTEEPLTEAPRTEALLTEAPRAEAPRTEYASTTIAFLLNR